MCLFTDHIQQPWTDVTQTIVALLGLIATIIGVYVLLRRDKDKEEQIKKLSDIAANLNQMALVSEKRYIQTRKPILDIKATVLKNRKEIKLKFTNLNLTSTVENYRVTNLYRKYYDTIISDLKSTHQEFGIILHYENYPDEFQVLQMRYETTEEYVFVQTLIIFYEDNGAEVNQDPVWIEEQALKMDYLS